MDCVENSRVRLHVVDGCNMKKPNDVDKNTWEKMEEFTKGWGYLIGYLAVIFVVLLMIKDLA